jgi:D-alanyl-D-alanine carboxypeptidase
VNPPLPLPPRLAAIHAELGIPENHGTERGMVLHGEARVEDLVFIGRNPDGRELQLVRPAASAWEIMRSAAQSDRIELIPISAFRSIERQREIIAGKLSAGKTIAEILRYVAPPGFSEHHTGRAIDIGTHGHLDLEEDFATTPAFQWLATRAAGFGFSLSYPPGGAQGIAYEPWHWCWS